MTTGTTGDEPGELASRLIAADRAATGHAPITDHTPGGIDPMFERLLQDERRFEEKVRRIAIGSWCLAFACLLITVSAAAFLGDVRLSARAELGEAIAMVLVPVGVVALLAAMVTSVTWLFRSRTPTLRAIALRLESLERRISAER